MKAVLVLALLGLAAVAQAACPNACSGHGTCGDYDMCECYRNFRGGDCSQRVCQYHHAFVTTPQGDLNHDGDLNDGTIIRDDYLLSDDGNSLRTQAAPGGTWEAWPHQFTTAQDEGHFYMECSNRGLCDRKTGECVCFDGYEGAGCRRTVCPDNCNNRGVCKTINQLKGATTYDLWDGDMDRVCVCDAGFTGPTCAEKVCPKGDDALTKEHQVDETQHIQIYSACATGAAACPHRASSATSTLGGTFTVTYTDEFGEAWTTDKVTVQGYDGAASATQVATDLKAALKAIPNDRIKDVQVTAGYCEKQLTGTFTDFNGATAPAAAQFMRCPNSESSGTSCANLVVTSAGASADGGVVAFTDVSACGGTGGTAGNAYATDGITTTGDVCTHLPYSECIELQVKFTRNSGSVTLLSVDHTAVTRYDGATHNTNAMVAAALVGSTVSKTSVIIEDSALTVAYKAPGATWTGTTGSWSGDNQWVMSAGTGFAIPANSKVSLVCNSVPLGEYTVASTVASAGTTITLTENIVASGQAGNACKTNAGLNMVVTLVSDVVIVNFDPSYANLVGKAVQIDVSGTKTRANAVVESVAAAGHIFLSTSADWGDITQTAGTADLEVIGTGTKEQVECAGRGVCNRQSGLCKCFKGYTNSDCSGQNSLAA